MDIEEEEEEEEEGGGELENGVFIVTSELRSMTESVKILKEKMDKMHTA